MSRIQPRVDWELQYTSHPSALSNLLKFCRRLLCNVRSLSLRQWKWQRQQSIAPAPSSFEVEVTSLNWQTANRPTNQVVWFLLLLLQLLLFINGIGLRWDQCCVPGHHSMSLFLWPRHSAAISSNKRWVGWMDHAHNRLACHSFSAGRRASVGLKSGAHWEKIGND